MDFSRIGFVLACLILPVAWGVVVHQIFEYINRRSKNGDASASNRNSPDYQI